ncbi:pol [Symbiodinium sp. CCMP2592]|nr:pol [Symbiodinium sp. CCMP2592]
MEEEMQVDPHSPTELAEGPDVSDVEFVGDAKRKRDPAASPSASLRAAAARAALRNLPGDGDTDDDESDSQESPTKRPHAASSSTDAPVSGRELRSLLKGHVRSMKEAWSEFEGRLSKVESQQRRHKGDVESLKGRTKVVERDLVTNKKDQELCNRKVGELAEEVKNLKVQWEDLKMKGPFLPDPDPQAPLHPPVPFDPWGDYIRKQQDWPAPFGPPQRSKPSGAKGEAARPGNPRDPRPLPAESLSEDEKRTLVIGGWLADTRRALIEEESDALLQHPTIRPLLDNAKLSVFGPRRSVGMLRFAQREDEPHFEAVKERMWKVIKAVSELKHQLDSTRSGGDVKIAWAGFVKTRAARQRTSHISMVRRVTIMLVEDTKDEAGGIKNIMNQLTTAYDMDWAAGTIWCGAYKLASSTHRAPRTSETVLMTGGWVDLDGVAATAGCTVDAAKAAFERGQALDTLDLALRDAEIAAVQEVSRESFADGWDTYDTDLFHWVTHRHEGQWRGTAIGIAQDRLDAVIDRRASSRGLWVLARIRGLGRVVIGSLHCHTGVTSKTYASSVCSFLAALPGKWRQYPALLGSDANECPPWMHTEGEVHIAMSGTNLNNLVDAVTKPGFRACAPHENQWHTPTHYPRDTERQGRQIDIVWSRQLATSNVLIEPDRRHTIGSDHAPLTIEIFTRQKLAPARWNNDSRARWVVQSLPKCDLVDADDVEALARQYSRPRKSLAYHDPDEVQNLVREAKSDGSSRAWKKVHRARRAARRQWQQERLERVVRGDWDAYRCLQNEKKRAKGWWGRMLDDRSSLQLTKEVTEHFVSKMGGDDQQEWSTRLETLLSSLSVTTDFVPFTQLDVREQLVGMKAKSAVGPDAIGVSLLREIMNHDDLAPQLVDIINQIVSELQPPEKWSVSYLALLAKCHTPLQPGDLRPICVSSAFNKLVNRLVCHRALPLMRRGSRISSCGKGRQCADLIGAAGRVRDVVREWRVPALLCKLDVAGAFDRINRSKVADVLLQRLQNQSCDHELKYLLAQLRPHHLVGDVPGGGRVEFDTFVGIKQGAPESAEVFGLVMDDVLSRLTLDPRWRRYGEALPGLDLDLMFYQDDVFILEDDFSSLIRRIRLVGTALREIGLELAVAKTKIIASPKYRGPRKAKVGDDIYAIAPWSESVKILGLNFSFFEPPSQQARELLGRARAAAAQHRDILRANGPWQGKLKLVRSLVEGTFAWTAGAVHWSSTDLKAANTLQLHILRDAFGIKRRQGEDWVQWNARSMRFCRLWMCTHSITRWSTKVLTLQHTLHGHWARRTEDCGHGVFPDLCLAMRALKWKNMMWWRNEQEQTNGLRHPQRFHAGCIERQLAECHGTDWFIVALDRNWWSLSPQPLSRAKLTLPHTVAPWHTMVVAVPGQLMDLNYVSVTEYLARTVDYEMVDSLGFGRCRPEFNIFLFLNIALHHLLDFYDLAVCGLADYLGDIFDKSSFDKFHGFTLFDKFYGFSLVDLHVYFDLDFVDLVDRLEGGAAELYHDHIDVSWG